MKATVRSIDHVSVVDLCGNIVIGDGETALRAKASALRHVRQRGGVLKLLKPSTKVSNLLELVRLTDVFETFRDEQVALASFPPH